MNWVTLLALIALSVAGSASAQRRPDFDPREVVRQVRGQGSVSRLVSEPSKGEFLIDTTAVYIPAPGGERVPAVASDGVNFLAVWVDERFTGGDLSAARVSQNGVLLDPGSFVISTEASLYSEPAAASDGSNFLVVWARPDSNDDMDIYGARVNGDGTILDSGGLAISAGPCDEEGPAVAFDGTNFLVVWSTGDLYCARVSPSGSVIDSAGIAISTAVEAQRDPAVAFDGTSFLVVWFDDRSNDIYAARVTRDGTVLDPNGFIVSSGRHTQCYPAAAFDGTDFLVVWEDWRSDTSADVYGARVSPSGTVLDPDGIAISALRYWETGPAVAFDGTNVLVVWQDGRGERPYGNIYGARVNRDGAVLDPGGIAISSAEHYQGTPAVTFGGTDFFAAWEDHRNSWRHYFEYDIYGARVSLTGAVPDSGGILISTVADDQECPAVASDGTDFLVVWVAWRNDSFQNIYGARVNRAGDLLDPAGFVISSAANRQRYPAVAFVGADYLVVWEDGRSGSNYDVYGARVDRDGRVLDPEGIAISAGADYRRCPAVASGDTNYLVVWQDWRNGNDFDIYGARLCSDGTVLDPKGFLISSAANSQEDVAVAFDGTEFLVVWQDWRDGGYPDIAGARVTNAGAVLDPGGIAISTDADVQRYPKVTPGRAGFLVVWEDLRSSNFGDIYGARVTYSGAVLDTEGILISAAGGAHEYPVLAFDGSNYLVAWKDYATGIYGARVSQAGNVFDSGPIVSQRVGWPNPAALACGSDGRMLLVYQGLAGIVGDKTYNSDRIWAYGPFPGGVSKTPVFPRADSLAVSPNPFSDACRIRLDLSRPSPVSLKLYDASGRVAGTVFKGEAPVGTTWFDFQAEGFAAGVYFLRLETSYRRTSTKLVLTE